MYVCARGRGGISLGGGGGGVRCVVGGEQGKAYTNLKPEPKKKKYIYIYI